MATEIRQQGIPVTGYGGVPVPYAMAGLPVIAADQVWIDPDLEPEALHCSEPTKDGRQCTAYATNGGMGMCVGHHRSWLNKQQRSE